MIGTSIIKELNHETVSAIWVTVSFSKDFRIFETDMCGGARGNPHDKV